MLCSLFSYRFTVYTISHHFAVDPHDHHQIHMGSERGKPKIQWFIMVHHHISLLKQLFWFKTIGQTPSRRHFSKWTPSAVLAIKLDTFCHLARAMSRCVRSLWLPDPKRNHGSEHTGLKLGLMINMDIWYIHTYIHYITLHYITLHYMTLHYHTYIHTLHYITAQYITLHYITLHYIHYFTLHYITLHYITLHTYIHNHTYIHAYIQTYMHTYIT